MVRGLVPTGFTTTTTTKRTESVESVLELKLDYESQEKAKELSVSFPTMFTHLLPQAASVIFFVLGSKLDLQKTDTAGE